MSSHIPYLIQTLLDAIQNNDRTQLQRLSRSPNHALQKAAYEATDCISGEFSAVKKK
jgi:hypothetical protein